MITTPRIRNDRAGRGERELDARGTRASVVQERHLRARSCASEQGRSRPATPPQFSTRLVSGLSSENVGTSTSNLSPLSLTIW